MKTYRIVEVKKETSSGYKTVFHIQKKKRFLFWFYWSTMGATYGDGDGLGGWEPHEFSSVKHAKWQIKIWSTKKKFNVVDEITI